jgi:hypothetical protein
MRPAVHLHVAEALERQGKYDEAIREYAVLIAPEGAGEDELRVAETRIGAAQMKPRVADTKSWNSCLWSANSVLAPEPKHTIMGMADDCSPRTRLAVAACPGSDAVQYCLDGGLPRSRP